MAAVRKLRIEDQAGTPKQDNNWRAAVCRMSTELHAPDGTLFVADVGEMFARGDVPSESWVGVLHGDFSGDTTFAAALESCKGLWVMSLSAKEALIAAEVPVTVALFPAADAGADLEGLVDAVANGAIYRSLPTPRSEASGLFRTCDLTVMLCSYKRVQNIGPILNAFCEQTYTGSIEVIIWNNNPDATADLEAAIAPYRTRLDLTVLHSSRNYYCIVRLAMAQLMRGEHLMICDDDVKPGPRFLEIFVRGLDEAGDKAVICARGNTFRPHKLNVESPESVWEKWDHLDFWDVGDPSREIHFMHGSSCLVPKAAILELSGIDLPNRESILVDDYWLSFALSGKLGWKIWKIDASDAFSFDASAADPEVALWLNSRVQQERTNFYVYHMNQGWPDGCSA